MAERTHNKPLFIDHSKKDDRPSQMLSFSFSIDESITDHTKPNQTVEKKFIHLQSNEIKFFHSQKSVWFRQLLKAKVY